MRTIFLHLSTAAVLCVFAMASGCSEQRKDPRFRYRITVEVQTPQGVVSGSTVREIGIRYSSCMGPQLVWNGEAVAINITPSETIFALVEPMDGVSDIGPTEIAAYALSGPAVAPLSPIPWKAHDVSSYFPISRMASGTHELPKLVQSPAGPLSSPIPLWPTFVRFANIQVPTSTYEVDPAQIKRGYYVKRILISQTTDRPIYDLMKRYPALALVGSSVQDEQAAVPLGSLGGKVHENDFTKMMLPLN